MGGFAGRGNNPLRVVFMLKTNCTESVAVDIDMFSLFGKTEDEAIILPGTEVIVTNRQSRCEECLGMMMKNKKAPHSDCSNCSNTKYECIELYEGSIFSVPEIRDERQAKLKHDLAEAIRAFRQANGLIQGVLLPYGTFSKSTKSVWKPNRAWETPQRQTLQQLEDNLRNAKNDFKKAVTYITKISKEQKVIVLPVLCEACDDTGKVPCKDYNADGDCTEGYYGQHWYYGHKCKKPCPCKTTYRNERDIQGYGSLRAGWRVREKVYYYIIANWHSERRTFPIDKIARYGGNGFKVDFTLYRYGQHFKTVSQTYSSVEDMTKDLRREKERKLLE